MGQKTSSVKDSLRTYHSAFKARVVEDVVALFAEDATLHFFSVQDNGGKPLVFQGRAQLEAFFKLYLHTFPALDYAWPEDDEMDSSDGPERDEGAEAALREAQDLGGAGESDRGEHVTFVSSFLDDHLKTSVIVYKYPQRGYRFVQESMTANAKGLFSFFSITMDTATDFSGLALATSATADAAEDADSPPP